MSLLHPAYGQYENEKDATIPLKYFYIKKESYPLRSILSKFTVSVSTGAGRTSFSHRLEGFGLFQEPDSVPRLFDTLAFASTYLKWVNRLDVEAPHTLLPGTFVVQSDTAKIGFRSHGFNMPLRVTVNLQFERYRVGAGYSYEYIHFGDFKPITFKDKISSFAPDNPSIFVQKYFAMIGGEVYRYNDYLLVADANFGTYDLGKTFESARITKGIFINLGATVERDLSEYLKVFVRPSYEFKSYTLNIPEFTQGITHRMNAFYVNVGATYRLPDLPRCFLKDCKVQIDHAHGNKLYRSRVHPIYKKQNPHYGEDYPNLIKYKGKNKHKLNPY